MVNIHTSLILITTHLYFYGVKFKLYYNSISMLKRQNEVNYSFFNGISIYTHFFLQCIMPMIIIKSSTDYIRHETEKQFNTTTQPLIFTCILKHLSLTLKFLVSQINPISFCFKHQV